MISRSRLVWFLAPLLLAASTGSGLVAQPTPGFSQSEILTSQVRYQMAVGGIPGLGMVVADSHGTLWLAAFGTANREHHVPFTVHTLSNVASVSKTFTAAAVLKLVEEGRVDLDLPYQDYVPEFSPLPSAYDSHAVTVRRILTHHSGLASDVWHGIYREGPNTKTKPGELEPPLVAANSVPLSSPPGSVNAYSNLGFGLLGVLVERVSGMDLNAFITQEILAPAGILDSGYEAAQDNSRNFAAGYRGNQNLVVPYLRDRGAVSFNASASDLGKYASMLLAAWKGESPVLSRKSMEALFSPLLDDTTRSVGERMGLAWMAAEFPRGKLMWHGGDWDSYHALIAVDPVHDLAVAVIVNGGGVTSASLVGMVLAAYLEFGVAKGVKIDSAAPATEKKEDPVDRFPAQQMKSLMGNYTDEIGVNFYVARQFPRLISIFEGNNVDLEHHPDGRTTIALHQPGRTDPTLVPGDDRLIVYQDGIPIDTWKKMEQEPIRGEWSARAGVYQVINEERYPYFSEIKLGIWGDAFGLQLSRGPGGMIFFPLTTVETDLALVSGTGRYRGDAVRVIHTPEGEELEYSGYRLRRLR